MLRLSVLLDGLKVGELIRDDAGELRFAYEKSWLENSRASEISCSLPLTHQTYRGRPVQAFFSNLLPDLEGTRQRIAREFRLPKADVFSLLSAIGRDCVGAFQFLLDSDAADVNGSLQPARRLSDRELAGKLDELPQFPLGLSSGEEDFRVSIAGAQAKTALLFRDGSWHLPLGATPSTHILKVPLGRLSQNGADLSTSCENEWFCLQICSLFGLPAASARIVDIAGRKALAVSRFDRKVQKDGTVSRLLTEDFCQALGVPPETKYETDGGPGVRECLKLLAGSVRAVQDMETFFRAQVVFWMIDAIDGHAKNFSLFHRRSDAYCMTPLYDVLSVAPLVAAGNLSQQKISLAMGIHGKNRHYRIEEIEPRHFLATAAAGGLGRPQAESILRQVAQGAADVAAQAERLAAAIPREVWEPILTSMMRKAQKLQRQLADRPI
jgi:serine/threonine-protein kinase HipA